MDNQRNLLIYRLWSPIYDILLKRLFSSGRKRGITLLDLKPSETLLIPGIGTGLDLPLLMTEAKITGVDLSQDMLAKARQKVGELNITLWTNQLDCYPFDNPYPAALRATPPPHCDGEGVRGRGSPEHS